MQVKKEMPPPLPLATVNLAPGVNDPGFNYIMELELLDVIYGN